MKNIPNHNKLCSVFAVNLRQLCSDGTLFPSTKNTFAPPPINYGVVKGKMHSTQRFRQILK